MQNHFDTFEDEKEMAKLIKELQALSIEYMKQPNAWEFESPPDKELICK